jgi:hypothetical protein
MFGDDQDDDQGRDHDDGRADDHRADAEGGGQAQLRGRCLALTLTSFRGLRTARAP